MTDSSSCAPCETRLHQTSIRETTPDGQRAIVTGANSGIGEAIAKGLAEAGASVVVNYVSGDDKAERVVAEIPEDGGRAFAHKADVSSEEQVQAMFRTACQELGSVDILVSNAGLQQDARFHEMPHAQGRRWKE